MISAGKLENFVPSRAVKFAKFRVGLDRHNRPAQVPVQRAYGQIFWVSSPNLDQYV